MGESVMTDNSPPPLRFVLPDRQATWDVGFGLGRSLPPSANLLLYGNLGSGKTTLVQGLGQGLGINDPIVSPTFTLINEYLEGRLPLYHFDLYRLTTTDTSLLAPDIYWEGIEYEPGIVVMEWAERLPYHPPHYLQIQLSLHPESSGRGMSIASVGEGPITLKQVELVIHGVLSPHKAGTDK